MELEIDSKIPIYIQLINYLKKKIISGELKGGEKMPSVREFAGELKVNPNTVQRVYSELEGINLIFTKRGIGKYVTEDYKIINNIKKEMFTEVIDKFIKDSKELGFSKDEIISNISERFKED